MRSRDSLTEFYSNNRDALLRAHRAVMGPIAANAESYMDRHGLHYLVHEPGFENIRNLPESEHLAEIKRMRGGEESGPENENAENDRALGPRAQRMPGHTRRTGLVR